MTGGASLALAHDSPHLDDSLEAVALASLGENCPSRLEGGTPPPGPAALIRLDTNEACKALLEKQV